MLDSLLALAASSTPLLVLVALLVAFGESVPGLGFLLPGEMTIIGLSALDAGPTRSAALWAAVAVGAVAGDHLGYGLGRRHGDRVREWAPLRRIGAERWDRAESFVRRRGVGALVASRMVPVVRTLLPVVAGIAGLRYRSFVLASLAGCTLWAALWVTGGAALHAALGPAALPALAGGGLAALVVAGSVAAARRTRTGV